MPYRIQIEDGRSTRTHDVRARDVTVGSHASCGLRLKARGVGPRHARLRLLGDRVEVEDLGAPVGLRVRGLAVVRAMLAVGDEVSVGDAYLRVIEIRTGNASEYAGSGDTLPLGPLGRRRRRLTGGTFIALSVAAHALIFLVVWGVAISGEARHEDPAHVEMAALIQESSIPEKTELVPLTDPLDLVEKPDTEVELLPPEDDSLPDTPLLANDDRFLPPPKQDPEPESEPTEVRPEPETVRAVVGVGASPLPAFASKSFGKGEAGSANRIAAGLLEDDAGGGAALRAVRGRAARTNIWVVRGDYDQAEKVLDALSIDHDLLAKDDLETHDVPASVRVLIYNCTGRPYSPETQRRIAAWVEAGGWLITTDWGVERLIERGLPGTLTPLRVGDRPVVTKDETVFVSPAQTTGLAAGVPRDGLSRWWLEDSSVPFTVADGIGAEVLVTSADLERRHGHDAAGVAVTFPHGRGRVLHLMGHIFQQEGNVRGAVIVHRLLVNFLAAALAR